MRKYISLFLRAIKSPLGLLGTLFLLVKPIKGTVAWMGDMEFVVKYWPKAMTFLDTGLGFATTIIGGALIISYAVFNAAREQPETPVTHKPQQPMGRPIQTEAITDDNPEGTWKRAGGPDMVDFEPPNFNAWRLNEYTILQASFLFAEESPEPNYSFLAGGSLGYFNMLMQAVKSQELPAWEWNGETPLKDDPSVNTKLKCEDLITFAKKRGLKSDFLSPNQDGG